MTTTTKKTGGPVPDTGQLVPPSDALRRLRPHQRPSHPAQDELLPEHVNRADHNFKYTNALPPMVLEPLQLTHLQKLVVWLGRRVGLELQVRTSLDRVNNAIHRSYHQARDEFFKGME